MVRVFANSGGREWREITGKASVTWTESLTEAHTATVSTPLDIPPEDWPARMIIVPMSLRDPRNARSQPPVYGPYDLASPKYGSPRGTILQGELGHHYGELIADGSANLVGQVVGQVEGFGQYEPFLGWGRAGDQDAFQASYGSGGRGGLSFVGSRVLAELATAASLDDVATGAAVWGFAVYIIISWTADGAYAEQLAVWPRHPLVLLESTIGTPSYAVQPRVGQVRGWDSGGGPSAFAAPNIALPVAIEPQAGRWKQRPEIDFHEVLNSPAHFPRSAYSAAWDTRRVIAGRRSLSGLSGFQIFRTGGAVPPPAYWIDAAAPSAQLAKGVEELQRWDWQNSSAVLSGTRYPDLSADLIDIALAPHQLLTVPAADLPQGWDESRRQFVVRKVRHEWDPKGGYRQHVQATLWQGPFARLPATASGQ